jgi:hypothetical protein
VLSPPVLLLLLLLLLLDQPTGLDAVRTVVVVDHH